MASAAADGGVGVGTKRKHCRCCCNCRLSQDPNSHEKEPLEGEAKRARRLPRPDMGRCRKNRLGGANSKAAQKAITDGTKSSPPAAAAAAVLEPREGGNEVAEGRLLLEVLHSFVIFIHSSGRILFVSDNVEDHLGLSQVSLIGRAATDFIHPEDAKELTKQMKFKQKKSHAEVAEEGRNQTRLFYMRMKFYYQRQGARTRQSGYKLVQFSGRLQLQQSAGASPGQAGTVQGLLCLCRPMQVPSVLEIRMDGNMFLSRHDLRMTFTFCDPRIITLIGYEPNELIGRTAYYFHNPLDATKISNCHSNLIVKGTSVSKYYRFMGKQGSWVWMQTRATIIYNTKNKPQYIVCMNYVIGEEEGQRYLMMEQEQLGYQDPNIQGCLDVASSPPTSHRSEDAGYGSASSSAASSPESDTSRGGSGGAAHLDHLDVCHSTSSSSTQTLYGVLHSQPAAVGSISTSSCSHGGIPGYKAPGASLAEASQTMGHVSSEDFRATEAPMDVSDGNPVFVCSVSAPMNFGDSRATKRVGGGSQGGLMLPQGGNNFCLDALHSEELDSLRPGDSHSPMETVSPGDEDLLPMGCLSSDNCHSAHLSPGPELSESSGDLQNNMDGIMLSRSGLMQPGSSVATTTMNNPMMSMSSLGSNMVSCSSQVSGVSSESFPSSGVTDNDMDPFFFPTEPFSSVLEPSGRSVEDPLDLLTLLETMADPTSLNSNITSLEESIETASASPSAAPAPSVTSTTSSGSENFTPMPSHRVDQQNRSTEYGGLESLVNFCHNTPPEKIAVSPSLVCSTPGIQASVPATRPVDTCRGSFAAPTCTASKSQQQQQRRQQGNVNSTLQIEQGSLLGQMLVANSTPAPAEATATSPVSTAPAPASPRGDQSFSRGGAQPLQHSPFPRPRSSSQQSLLRTLLDKDELTEEELALIPGGSRPGEPAPCSSRAGSFETDLASLRQPRRKSSTSESGFWSQPRTPVSSQDPTPRMGSLLSLQMGVPSPSECSQASPGTPSSSSNLPDDIIDFAMQFIDKFDSDQASAIIQDIDEQMFDGQEDGNFIQPVQTFSRPKPPNGKMATKAAATNTVSTGTGTKSPRETQGSGSSPYDAQRGCHHDHAYFAAQEPRRNSFSSPWRNSSGKVPQASQGSSQAAGQRMLGSGSSGSGSCRGSSGKVPGKFPGVSGSSSSNSSSKLQAMLSLTQSMARPTPGGSSSSSSSSPCGPPSSQQPSPGPSLPPPSPLSDSGSCSSGSSGMSELEKHLRGFVPQSPSSSSSSSCKKSLSGSRNSSVPFLQKLLTGELSQELYREIDHQLITQERQSRTALHKSLPDMRV